MVCQYNDLFVDEGRKKSFNTKHLRRVGWVKNNVKHIQKQYNLQNVAWKVRSLFVVNEKMVSAKFFSKDTKIITYSELTSENLGI